MKTRRALTASVVSIATALALTTCSGNGSTGPLGTLTLAVTIVLPSQAEGDSVNITGPAGFDTVLRASAVIRHLPEGTYQINPGPTVSPNGAYAAPSQSVSLRAQAETHDTVYYHLVTGSISLVVSGLPAGMSTAISTTPGPFNGAVALTTVMNGSDDTVYGYPPGSVQVYPLVAGTVGGGTPTYDAAMSAVTVAVSDTPTVVHVAYAPHTGTLTVDVDSTGLPPGVSPKLWIGAQFAPAETVSASTTLGNVALGDYTIRALTVNGPSSRFSADTLIVGGFLLDLEHPAATVHNGGYFASGAVDLTVTWPPSDCFGYEPVVYLIGNGEQLIFTSTEIANLHPGTYVVAGAPFCGTTAHPSADTVQVTASYNFPHVTIKYY